MIKEKVSEEHPRYFGHMKRREEGNLVKAMMMPVRGRRSIGRQQIRVERRGKT